MSTEPARPVAPPHGAERWIEEIREGLRSSAPGSVLLVDSAAPEQLGRFVRSLMQDHPELDVLADVDRLESLPDGGVVVLAPPPAAAAGLRVCRPLLARKALRMVLWCDAEVAAALAHESSDFFASIAQRRDCPPGAAEHAVWGLRRALCRRAPGVLFVCRPLDKGRFERVFRAALPGRDLEWLDPDRTSYPDLVGQIREAGRAWVGCEAWHYGAAERVRWALAEARRRTRAALLVAEAGDDLFWKVTDAVCPLGEAVSLLAGAKRPGRLAAAAGLGMPALTSLTEHLAQGEEEEALLRAMLQSPDPAAALGEGRLSSGGAAPFLTHDGAASGPKPRAPGEPFLTHDGAASGPKPRAPGEPFLTHDGAASGPKPRAPAEPTTLHARAERIEQLLRYAPRTPELWLTLARLALEHKSADVAAFWAARSIELRSTFEAKLLYGTARAELGFLHWDNGFAAGARFVTEAMAALDEAGAMVAPETAPEDVLALHALRGYLLVRVGFLAEADEALGLALNACDASRARARDLLCLGRALMRRGKSARAEESLRIALEKANGSEELLEARVLVGQCALKLDRQSEAEATSAALLEELAARGDGWGAEGRIAAEQLHVEALLARDAPDRALAFIDDAVGTTVPWWESLRPQPSWRSPHAVWRLPLFARVLRRAGRRRDAEVLLRKLLGLPFSEAPDSIGLGLTSRPVLQAFLSQPDGATQLAPEMRASLLIELTRVLREQGRRREAADINSTFRGRSEP